MKSTEYMLYKSVNLFGGLVIRVVPYYVEDNGVPSYITYSLLGYCYRIDNTP